MRCETLGKAGRCANKATHEVLMSCASGSRWRPACGECLAMVRRHASPLDRLQVRLIEVTDRDEQHRRRLVKHQS